MELSVQSAQRIVDEISGIVGQHINMMDERGNIIASTDGTRVGHFHAGAKRIVEEGLPELYVRPEDATPTVRAGLNLPITHGGRTVGVIGITGAYEQVIGYGQVVKKMTEILIREGNEQDEKRLDQRVRSRFLEDWVLGSGLLQPRVLEERGFALGIDISQINVKATTEEGLGFTGTGEGISSQAICLLNSPMGLYDQNVSGTSCEGCQGCSKA